MKIKGSCPNMLGYLLGFTIIFIVKATTAMISAITKWIEKRACAKEVLSTKKDEPILDQEADSFDESEFVFSIVENTKYKEVGGIDKHSPCYPFENAAIRNFFEEINSRKNRPHPIEDWGTVLCAKIDANGRTYNWEWANNHQKIVIRSKGEDYIAKVTYGESKKDDSLYVISLETKDFKLRTTKSKRLAYEDLHKTILDLLKADDVFGYCEGIYGTCYYNELGDETATFNAPLAMKVTEKEWKARYGTSNGQKAWINALAERFGGLQGLASVKALDKIGCFSVKLPDGTIESIKQDAEDAPFDALAF